MAGIVPKGDTFDKDIMNVKKTHVEMAVKYLEKYGHEKIIGEKVVLYDVSKPNKVSFRANGRLFGIVAVVRVAYLCSLRENPSSKFSAEDIKKVISMPYGKTNPNPKNNRWNSRHALRLLKKLGYKDNDFDGFSTHKKRKDESDDVKKILFDDIKPEHIEKALDYILQQPKEKNGILYVVRPAQKNIIEYDKEERFVGKKFGARETFRLAFLCCAGIDMESLDRSKFHDEFHKAKEEFGPDKRIRMSGVKRILKNLGIKIEDDAHELLKQFYQIIFYGPPGTGKTYAAMDAIADVLNVDEEKLRDLQGKRWDIVQFHPSYNYEDFVRGVKVTTKGKNVAYTTENRIFGDMCLRAKKDDKNNYVLIIDEINRANVSAVLGELIYALEYRGKEIKTPYNVGGDKGDVLVIPENLYIIGTMNTADRTIGQIDYAVRRRFAFEHCPPEREVIEEHIKNPKILKKVLQIYDDIEKLFEEGEEQKYLSQDYGAKDVQIGHSYFLHDAKRTDISPNKQISQKIIYQVIPVLQEYIKDGILSKAANEEIDKIKQEASKLFNDKFEGE